MALEPSAGGLEGRLVTRPANPPLERSERGDALARETRERLRDLGLESLPAERDLAGLFDLVDRFHRAVFEASPDLRVSCGRGCSGCCSQMVFDVHAFEVERIGRRLVETGRVELVGARLEERRDTHARVRRDHPRRNDEDVDDWIERVAIEFWKEDESCALLDTDGACSVHDVRPWSCRRSFAASDPALCCGDHADDPRRRFFTLAPDAGFDADLQDLDRFATYDVDTDQLDLGLLRWLGAHAPTRRG